MIFNDLADCFIGNITLVRFRVDRNQNNLGCSLQVVDHSVAAAFPSLGIAISQTYLKDGISYARNLVAGAISSL